MLHNSFIISFLFHNGPLTMLKALYSMLIMAERRNIISHVQTLKNKKVVESDAINDLFDFIR